MSKHKKNEKVTIVFIHPTIRDRSYQNELWEFIAENNTHINLRRVKKCNVFSNYLVLLKEEYDIQPANDFIVED